MEISPDLNHTAYDAAMLTNESGRWNQRPGWDGFCAFSVKNDQIYQDTTVATWYPTAPLGWLAAHALQDEMPTSLHAIVVVFECFFGHFYNR